MGQDMWMIRDGSGQRGRRTDREDRGQKGKGRTNNLSISLSRYLSTFLSISVLCWWVLDYLLCSLVLGGVPRYPLVNEHYSHRILRSGIVPEYRSIGDLAGDGTRCI
jgi:hypothetical protein